MRRAQFTDVAALVELSEQKRLQYQQYQPHFWRKAVDSREKQLPFFEKLVNREDVITLVYEQAGKIEGFIVADIVTAPPVYDPQGLVCRVDDYCIATGQTWESVGQVLLEQTLDEAKQRGATLMVIVCGHRDLPKRALLAEIGFSIASEWYVKDL